MPYSKTDPKRVSAKKVTNSYPGSGGRYVDITIDGPDGEESFTMCLASWDDGLMDSTMMHTLQQDSLGNWLEIQFREADIGVCEVADAPVPEV
jgi:hypothetical protein